MRLFNRARTTLCVNTVSPPASLNNSWTNPKGTTMRTFLLATVLSGFVSAAHAQATTLIIGHPFAGTVVACGTQGEAETLLSYVAKGEMDTAKEYLAADDNSCSIGPMQFTPVAQVGRTSADPAGHVWRIVEMRIRSGEAYMLTTSPIIVVSSNT